MKKRKDNFVEENIDIATKTINYIYKKGRGTPVVILHGAGANAQVYSSLLKNYKMRNPVYILTLPGFGKSENIKRTFTLDHYSHLIYRFLEKKKIKKIILIGHSIGGDLAIVFSRLYPKKIDRMIVASPAGLHPDKKLTLKRVEDSIKRGISSLRKRRFVKRRGMFEMIKDVFNLNMWKELDYFARFDITKYFPIKQIKSLILWPLHDDCPETPSTVANQFKKNIKNSKLIFVKGDHSFPLVYPKIFWKHIEKFLGLK